METVKEINREALQLNREGKFDEAGELLEDLLEVNINDWSKKTIGMKRQ